MLTQTTLHNKVYFRYRRYRLSLLVHVTFYYRILNWGFKLHIFDGIKCLIWNIENLLLQKAIACLCSLFGIARRCGVDRMSVFSRLNKWRGGVGPLLWDEWATGTHGGTGASSNPWFENQRGHISISSSLYGRLDFVSMCAPCRDNMETTGVLIQELFTTEPHLESREERSSVFISFLFCFGVF